MNQNKHIISIAGDLASGKSNVTTLLKEKLGYEIYRNGEYFRSLAREKGMSVKDFNIYVEAHPEIDRDIEKSAAIYAENHDNVIIDARLGWYAVPHSFKVYLTVDPDEGAKRVFQDTTRKSEEKYHSVEHAKEEIKQRYELENKRYFELYGVKKQDLNNYDFVLDTTNISLEESSKLVYEAYIKWIENK